ncbi:inner nuclear membrane protein Man1 [Sarotherodon galilaeus]
MSGGVGQMDVFDNGTEDWTTYVERVEQYCLANKVEDERKVAVLLSVMGAKTYNLLRSLITPAKPADKSFKEITEVLQKHFQPKPLVIAERFRFHKRNQLKNEATSEYIAELRRLSEHCQFGEGLSDVPRDRFVCGMNNESTQKRLLTEDNLTLHRALEIAISMETAAKDAGELQGKCTEPCSVNKIHPQRNNKLQMCFRCGKKSHDAANCWFKEKECLQCNKKGHIQKMCKSKQYDKNNKMWKRERKLHEVNETESNDSQEDLACLELYTMQEKDNDAIWLTPKIQGVELQMELDTGSALSLISYEDYRDKFPNLKLKHTSVKLNTYTGERITPLGKLKVKVEYEKKKCNLELYVLKNGGVPLFGRDWLKHPLQLERNKVNETGTRPECTFSRKQVTVRICGDFKVSVNPVLRIDQYPLPRIEDIFTAVAGGKHFSKIDLAQAYLQMEVEETSRKYLVINTHKGLYQYNRLVFGIASAPAVWQRAMDQVLQGIPGTQCFLDDIIVTGVDEETHLANLTAVLARLEKYGLRANKNKCEFFKDAIEYCGHKIDRHGLHKTKDKVEALRSFLGLINYYHKFLPNLSTVLHPLHSLLQQNVKWKWTKNCEEAFNGAKQLITSEEVLRHFDPNLPLRLTIRHFCQRPVAFASRSLNAPERNYAQIDREALSLVWGVKKFNQYLYGRHFALITDHRPLVSIFHPQKGMPTMAAARLQRWALFLGAHTYTIVFKGTKLHGNADGLSPTVFHVTQMEPLPVTSAQVKRETSRDTILSKVYDFTVNGWPSCSDTQFSAYSARKDQLSVCQGCVMWGTHVILPPKLRTKVLDSLHDGHLGVVKMKSLARSYVWWPGIDCEIENMAKSCTGCQQTLRQPQTAPVHAWEWPSALWQRIHIDLCWPIYGPNVPEIFPVKQATAASTINSLRSLFARTGLPQQLVSDNGRQFTGEEFQCFLRSNGIRHITSAPHHPATNGQAERFIQSFKQSMKASGTEGKPLQQKIDNFLLAYRNTTHATPGHTPAMLFMGRNLRSHLDLLKPDIRKDVQDKQSSMVEATRNKTRFFNVGQKVLARDYRDPSQKWQSVTILSRTGPLTYTINVGANLVWRRHVDQILDAESHMVPQQPESTSTPQDSEELAFASQPEVQDLCETTNAQTPELPTQSTMDSDQTGRRYPERNRIAPQRLNL